MVKIFHLHSKWIIKLLIYEEYQLLFSCSKNGEIKILNINNDYKIIHDIKGNFDSIVYDMYLSKIKNTLYLASNKTV